MPMDGPPRREQNGERSSQSWAGRRVGRGTGGGRGPQGGPLCPHGGGSLCCDGAQRALRWPPASPCGHDRHRRPSQLTASLPAGGGTWGGVLLLIASVAGSWPDLCAHQEWPRGRRLLPACGSPPWSSRARPVRAGPTAAPLIAPGGSPPRGSDRPSPWGGASGGWAAADWGAGGGGGGGAPGTGFSPLRHPYQAQLHSCGIRPPAWELLRWGWALGSGRVWGPRGSHGNHVPEASAKAPGGNAAALGQPRGGQLRVPGHPPLPPGPGPSPQALVSNNRGCSCWSAEASPSRTPGRATGPRPGDLGLGSVATRPCVPWPPGPLTSWQAAPQGLPFTLDPPGDPAGRPPSGRV
ncbi:translation initiation factor IF-2-like [Vulpes lagopus]|uniref:translation initiation factor IF-2-like n=1 Tax=Vulpes lagopus TaxID=494514 RepID=UPI001BCA32F6|nr:translation initiation factor IF-2-like [Vulpes lagopus]